MGTFAGKLLSGEVPLGQVGRGRSQLSILVHWWALINGWSTGWSTGGRWARGKLSAGMLGFAVVVCRDWGLSRPSSNCCRMGCRVWLNHCSWKVMFLVTSKPTPPTVFNLQASDWVHCEEEAGSYYQLSRNTYKFVKKCTFLKLFILPKIYSQLKKFHKVYYTFFFSKRDNC